MARPTKKLVLAGILIVMLGVGFWLASSGILAQGQGGASASSERDRKDLATLRDAFRGQNVSVYFIHVATPPMEGMVKGVVDLFGKKFLRLETASGSVRLALIEEIVAVRQKE